MSCSHDLFQLRKAQKLGEALAKARQCFAADQDDLWLQRAYGWVLYDLIKLEVEAAAPGTGSSAVSARLNGLLAEYRRPAQDLGPDLLHSQLLTQVLKVSRGWPGFLEFARWWDSQRFRPEDRQPYVPPHGRPLPSLALRYAYAVGREACRRQEALPPDLLGWAEAELDEALRKAPDDQWLHYYKSKLLMGRGQVADARAWLLPVVRRQRNAPWVWTLLGRTHEQDDPDKAATCYFRAVQLAQQAQDVAGTRISLARLLAVQERYEEAAVQVTHALHYRQSAQYRIPGPLAQLAGADWYRRLADQPNLPPEPDVTEAATALLCSEENAHLVYRTGVVDNQNPDKALAHVAFGPDDGVVMLYRRFRGIERVAVGAIIEIGFVDGERSPLRWRRCDLTRIDGFVREMHGTLSQPDGKPFAFLLTGDGERVFIHPALLTRRPDQTTDRLSCIAMKGLDQKKGMLGWKALRWTGPADAE